MNPIRTRGCLGICVSLVVCINVFAADTGGNSALKEAGLTRTGDVYVLPDEQAVVDGVKVLRASKVQADKETKARKLIENQIAVKKKIMKDADKEYHELETRLGVIQDVGIHNRIVTRLNRLVADHKQAMADVKDLEEQAGKVSSVAKTKFVDDVATLSPKADAVAEKYKALGDDAGVKAELAKLTASAANAKAAMGPSSPFTAAAADLKKWQSEVESETIPLREDGGIHMVDVLINGEHFVMGLDTGASSISLPGEVAEKLKIIPGEQDPVVHMQLADGNLIEGREMSLKTVRVGRFTLEEVRCVVLSKGLPNAPLILGGSFLNHFIVKLDPGASQLHLTEIKEGGAAKVAPASPKPTAPPTKGA